MMISGILLAALLGQADADPEKFDCKDQCKQMIDICLAGCEGESKAAKKEGGEALDCKVICGPAAERCNSACKQFDTVKARTKGMKATDDEADSHSHGDEH